jgi:preprotein translocase subunit SecA
MSFSNSILAKLFPDESKKTITSLKPIVDKVFSFEDELKALSDADLKARSLTLKSEIMEKLAGLTGDELKHAEKKVLDEALPLAFAPSIQRHDEKGSRLL